MTLGAHTKALVAAIVPLVASIILLAVTGEYDEGAMQVQIVGAITAVSVWFASNKKTPPSAGAGE